VGYASKTEQSAGQLSTAQLTLAAPRAENYRFYPYAVHKFCMQFCATKARKITGVVAYISTLSTALIINTSRKIKENYLLRTGG
jgi:hypothetical protein